MTVPEGFTPEEWDHFDGIRDAAQVNSRWAGAL